MNFALWVLFRQPSKVSMALKPLIRSDSFTSLCYAFPSAIWDSHSRRNYRHHWRTITCTMTLTAGSEWIWMDWKNPLIAAFTATNIWLTGAGWSCSNEIHTGKYTVLSHLRLVRFKLMSFFSVGQSVSRIHIDWLLIWIAKFMEVEVF